MVGYDGTCTGVYRDEWSDNCGSTIGTSSYIDKITWVNALTGNTTSATCVLNHTIEVVYDPDGYEPSTTVTSEWNLYDGTTLGNNGWRVVYRENDTHSFEITRRALSPVLSPTQRLREIIAHRHAPLIVGTRKALNFTNDIREMRARETLRRVIGERKYFNFLKSGFVSVKAKSGLVYQIFPGHGVTCVFNKGIMTDRLCVVLQGNFPETDSVIMRYLMILNNENQFCNFAVKHNIWNPQERREATIKFDAQKRRFDESLLDIYQSLKKAS